jgi:dTDP-glucose 4,6-dehydratase
VDNLFTGSLANIEHLNTESRFDFAEHDICLPFDPGKVGYVFNFTSPASPPD